MPLLSIAAALASAKLPPLLAKLNVSGVRGASYETLDSTFGVICTDYSGVTSGATLAPIGR
jgi:hypothetical protein